MFRFAQHDNEPTRELRGIFWPDLCQSSPENCAQSRAAHSPLGFTLAAIPQYAIVISAVAAHLGCLDAQGQARVSIEEETMIWQLMTR